MDNPIKIYISGPMSGLPEENYPAFFEAQKLLFEAGYKHIINPARIGEKESWEEYMKRDIQLLCQCDAVATLQGWGDSKGARLEVQVALALGLKVNTLDTWLARPLDLVPISGNNFSFGLSSNGWPIYCYPDAKSMKEAADSSAMKMFLHDELGEIPDFLKPHAEPRSRRVGKGALDETIKD